MDNIIYSPSGAVSLHISEDKMSAWISVQKSGKIIDEQEILDLIEQNGICYGFEEALAWMADNGMEKDFNKPFPVAICKPSNSEQLLNILFDKVKTYNPDKEWTFDDVKDWTFIEQGAVLADTSYNLFTEGGSIYNVFGELTTDSANNLDLLPYIGDNVKIDADKIVADVTGYPYVDKNNKICVLDNLVLNEDINNLIIPVSLAASLTVNGSITGTRLSVLKNLTVTGDIRRAEIYAEGNLFVTGDIVQCQTSGVVVLEDIKVRRILDSLVICKGLLSFDNIISGSRVIAEKQVVGNIEMSVISGSQIQTSGSIEAATIGNTDSIETELEVTISPFTKERMTQLTKAIIKLKESPDLNAGNIVRVEKELHDMEVQLSDDLNIFLKDSNSATRYVKAFQDIYPGVYIRVLKNTYTIKKYQTNAEFYEE